jgi:excisionase family DNA binding protein
MHLREIRMPKLELADALQAPVRPPAFTGVDAAARHVDLSVSTLRRMIAARELPARRVGGRLLIAYSDLERVIGAAPLA